MSYKILHLIDSGGLYGAEKMLLSLVAAQIANGLQPTILSAGELGIVEKPLEKAAKELDLPIVSWRMKPGFNPKEARKIIAWAHDHGYHLMHSHGYKFNVLMGLWPERYRKIPLVTTLHGYVGSRLFTKAWLYEWLDRRALRQMAGIVMVGAAMADKIPASISGSPRTRTIPNGLDIVTVQQRSQLPIGSADVNEFIERHTPVVLGVGRLSLEKAFDVLIDAFFTKVKPAFPDAGLLILGEGKQRETLERRIRESGGDQACACLPGYVENIPAVMSRSDVLSISSRTEGLPITLLEAMALGLPVISTRVGEIPSVLGQGRGGGLVSRIDKNELGDAVTTLLENRPDGKVKAAWATKKVTDTYSSCAMAAAYTDLYEDVLDAVVLKDAKRQVNP